MGKIGGVGLRGEGEGAYGMVGMVGVCGIVQSKGRWWGDI